MTKKEFTAKVYEKLAPGLKEIDGKLYYSEESVVDAMEWMKENMEKIAEVDIEKLLLKLTNLVSNGK